MHVLKFLQTQIHESALILHVEDVPLALQLLYLEHLLLLHVEHWRLETLRSVCWDEHAALVSQRRQRR